MTRHTLEEWLAGSLREREEHAVICHCIEFYKEGHLVSAIGPITIIFLCVSYSNTTYLIVTFCFGVLLDTLFSSLHIAHQHLPKPHASIPPRLHP